MEKQDRFAAPGPLGTTNLRSALALARAASETAPTHASSKTPAQPCALVRPPLSEASPAKPRPIVPKSGTAGEGPVHGPAHGMSRPTGAARPVTRSRPMPPLLDEAVALALTDGSGPAGMLEGTLIDTPSGPTPVEDLDIGDEVLTADRGAVPLVWCAAWSMPTAGNLAPVRFAPKVLGNRKALIVSPTQRILISGDEVRQIGGAKEALIAAHALVDGGAISREGHGHATYHLLMTAQHHLIRANGSWVSAFLPEMEAVMALPPRQISEFSRLFPDRAATLEAPLTPARPILRALEDIARATV